MNSLKECLNASTELEFLMLNGMEFHREGPQTENDLEYVSVRVLGIAKSSLAEDRNVRVVSGILSTIELIYGAVRPLIALYIVNPV